MRRSLRRCGASLVLAALSACGGGSSSSSSDTAAPTAASCTTRPTVTTVKACPAGYTGSFTVTQTFNSDPKVCDYNPATDDQATACKAVAVAAPGAFAITSATAGNGQVSLTWDASSAATRYAIQYGRKPGDHANTASADATSPATVSGLNNGFSHYMQVTASNTTGSRPSTNEVAVMPMYAPGWTYSCLRNLYVSTSGNNANSGTSVAQAYATINAATHRSDLKAGDCINVLPGTYTEEVVLPKGGSADSSTGYVVLRSATPLAARIIGPAGSYSAVNLADSYLAVDGFDVQGRDGAAIDGCLDIAAGRHHQVVINNLAHDSGGAGISLCWGDHYRIEGNVVRNNSSTNGYQTSGISIYQARDVFDSAPGFHIVVRNNVSYANVITFACNKCHTDGNGIIIDDFHNSQVAAGQPFANVNFPHQTLVENNLVFNNGGKGIQVYVSDHVTVRNNTAYHNNQDTNFDGTWRGELSNSISSNNTWLNNIAVTDPAINSYNRALSDTSSGGFNVNVVWRNNLAWAEGSSSNLLGQDGSNTPITAALGNLIGVDPKFIAASIDPTVADFRLQAGSPAKGAGTSTGGTDNLNGVVRAATDAVNIGAY